MNIAAAAHSILPLHSVDKLNFSDERCVLG